MGAKKYFKKEFQLSKFNLEHSTAADFYLSSWQRNRNTLPLLCVRCGLFAGCLAILVASMVLTTQEFPFGYWPIYMTHWGVVMITVTTGCAFGVSCRAYLKGPIESTFDLPWYIKVYWVLFNITMTLAIFITLYYYILLAAIVDVDFAVDPVLDFFIHGMNSILMFVLLMTSQHPTNLMHFFHPLLFGIVYLVFSVIYYAAGGTDPLGNPFIYPTLDWGEAPLEASLSIIISAVVLTLVHFLVTGMTVGRDALARRLLKRSKTARISENANQYS